MLIGFRARNHRQQVLVRGVRPEVDDRATTPEVFDPLEERFGFTVDVAASERNRKVERFYAVEDDGLAQSWAGERVWCNPPYSNIGEWVEKAWAETEAELVAMLLPANRTEQGWWQTMVEPFRDRAGSPLTTEFFAGRLRFIAHDKDRVEPNERPPFGCVLLVWNYEEPVLPPREPVAARIYDIDERELRAVAVARDELVSYLDAIGPDADLDDEEMPQTIRRDAAADLANLLYRHGIITKEEASVSVRLP